MESMITKYILPTDEIQNNIKEMKQYYSSNPEQDIPEEHSIEQWSNFLPPLKRIKMNTTNDIGEVFKDRLSESLRKGTQNQHEFISEIKSKMRIIAKHALIDHIVQEDSKIKLFLIENGLEDIYELSIE